MDMRMGQNLWHFPNVNRAFTICFGVNSRVYEGDDQQPHTKGKHIQFQNVLCLKWPVAYLRASHRALAFMSTFLKHIGFLQQLPNCLGQQLQVDLDIT